MAEYDAIQGLNRVIQGVSYLTELSTISREISISARQAVIW
ncbi:MAG TPA: hypothetical protein VMU69_00635 [Bradyrhizobium sp.]|nr:hypothetical protein [Bradyrhizobium sp.]